MPRGLFVTGTDTDVGKTFVTVQLINALKSAGRSVSALKPVCTGVSDEDFADVGTLAKATGQALNETCPAWYSAALSPPSAAKSEGRTVDLDVIDAGYAAHRNSDAAFVVVEGAGGVMCPVTESTTMLDLAERWSLPVLIVIGVRLGAINHALLSSEAVMSRSLQWSAVLCESGNCDQDVRDSTICELASRLGERIIGFAPNGSGLLSFRANAPTIGEMAGPPISIDRLAALFSP